MYICFIRLERKFCVPHSEPYINQPTLCHTLKGAFVWEYSGITIYSGYSAPRSRIAGMEIQVFRNRKSSQTNANLHYSNYSYSGLIPNECAQSYFSTFKLLVSVLCGAVHFMIVIVPLISPMSQITVQLPIACSCLAS